MSDELAERTRIARERIQASVIAAELYSLDFINMANARDAAPYIAGTVLVAVVMVAAWCFACGVFASAAPAGFARMRRPRLTPVTCAALACVASCATALATVLLTLKTKQSDPELFRSRYIIATMGAVMYSVVPMMIFVSEDVSNGIVANAAHAFSAFSLALQLGDGNPTASYAQLVVLACSLVSLVMFGRFWFHTEMKTSLSDFPALQRVMDSLMPSAAGSRPAGGKAPARGGGAARR